MCIRLNNIHIVTYTSRIRITWAILHSFFVNSTSIASRPIVRSAVETASNPASLDFLESHAAFLYFSIFYSFSPMGSEIIVKIDQLFADTLSPGIAVPERRFGSSCLTEADHNVRDKATKELETLARDDYVS